MKQRTISKECVITGVGLHLGKPATVVIKPAVANSGIVFVRTDLAGSPSMRLGTLDVVTGGEKGRYSAIKKGEAVVYTVEHLLAALSGLGIDNATIAISGDEAPGVDGSSAVYVKALREAGVVDLDAEQEVLEVREPIMVSRNGASVMVVPADEWKVSYSLEYPHPLLKQVATFSITPDIFEKDIAPARTFCLLEEAEAVKAQGLGQGANNANTLVFGPKGPLDNTLRFPDEPARHKILDCVGDFYLLGKQVKGHVIAFKSGHTLNRELLKKILQQKEKYESRRALSTPPQGNASAMDVRAIMNVIPHRYPFLLVDRILEIEPGKRAVAVKNVTMNEAFFQGHFPVRPVMPGVLMIEAMAQVLGVVALSNGDAKGKLAFFMAVDNVKFRKIVEPGDQLVMEVEIVKARSRIANGRGVCKVDGQVVCEADMGFAFGE
ncbi:MAG: UDP-3-O-[3-hydroxymyristoyl] N-acetylglucosamine deacetylase [Elusimicrobia bacterium]|nr:UDP-3-O-[3-hydroxymyristoyl] N-acetylglucosamine deacetylase [Elusimicrobiota bacterium]